ncbi:methylated-DNA--[protein]-cysteine S-methyltransferase [Legionella lytica]|uniref:Methylated-DNA--[protein]-cysteine S-methyltransferase n=1 Tax=Legionella lytica TaxID=96232 RepID=A0ABY4Y5U5_9GAMM|nr:methylated-DNA--[protein]-cysteine S-methyltransferase [Legionella lytica]USQ12987.1 methylated-DNA--[protein]-cysteine S-methyltransferase [Legionella lytica]
MIEHKQSNYERVETAINYINDHFKAQPSLDEIAKAIHVSPYHFQRIFSEWAGVSPKKFMQYISLNYAKSLLKNRMPLLDVTYETGLSSCSRLHDLFVNIEGMTPREFKNGGADLAINYCFAESPFGKVIIASTSKGVCAMSFEEDENHALLDLKKRFPNAKYHQIMDKFQQEALLIFQKDWSNLNKIKLHLAGTPFQLKVWESLLKIPLGSLVTYGDIAQDIGNPKSSRAVGSAIGSNPVAFLIPCHRVIQSSGKISGYLWGETKKKAIIGWEAAKIEL